MTHAQSNRNTAAFASWGIALLMLAYAVACAFGLPQQWRDAVVASSAAGSHEHESAGHEAPDHGDDEHHSGEAIGRPGYLWVVPFMALLGCIALLPLWHKTEHWWESNLHRFYVAAALAVVTLLYYLFGHTGAIDGHWPAHHVTEPLSDSWTQWGLVWTVVANALLAEYLPFIVLLFSLYTISGGIHVEANLAPRPITNAAFLLIGGLLASFLGTTGAAMLLIRPLLSINRSRKRVVHTVIFFIFVVCNCGGCLLPIGDPPLFLGYLRGVSFLWTLSLWPSWLFVNGMLIAIYLIWDHFFAYPREAETTAAVPNAETGTNGRRVKITGWQVNGPLLMGIVACVALLDSSKAIPGTHWHPWYYLREAVQLGLVWISLTFGSREIRRENRFNFGAIIEIAVLFLGIFICMQPALQILGVEGPRMGLSTPTHFYLATGGLSSVLDNAPTYVVFFETAKTLSGPQDMPVSGGHINVALLTAVSLGAVFMGAMTYIGNGPNFMVKALAETAGVRMPSFFGYLLYSCGVLLPLLLLTNWLFL